MLRTKSNHRLRLESLESRLMMDGNVNVTRSGAAAILTGDNAANFVEVTGDAVPGHVLVIGLPNVNTGVPTTISLNGVPQGTQVLLTGVTSIVAHLSGGNDGLTMTELVVGGSLTIDGTGGSKTVDLGNGLIGTGSLLVQGSATINLPGTGANQVYENGLGVLGSHGIATGSGNDYIQIRSSSTTQNELINTGAGVDVVNIGSFYVAGAFSTVSSGPLFFSGVQINAGGDQKITGGVNSGNSFYFDHCAGNVGHTVTVYGGNGPDTLSVKFGLYDRVNVSLCGGNDTVIAANTVANSVTIDGGPGTNTFIDGGGNVIVNLRRTRI